MTKKFKDDWPTNENAYFLQRYVKDELNKKAYYSLLAGGSLRSPPTRNAFTIAAWQIVKKTASIT